MGQVGELVPPLLGQPGLVDPELQAVRGPPGSAQRSEKPSRRHRPSNPDRSTTTPHTAARTLDRWPPTITAERDPDPVRTHATRPVATRNTRGVGTEAAEREIVVVLEAPVTLDGDDVEATAGPKTSDEIVHLGPTG